MPSVENVEPSSCLRIPASASVSVSVSVSVSGPDSISDSGFTGSFGSAFFPTATSASVSAAFSSVSVSCTMPALSSDSDSGAAMASSVSLSTCSGFSSPPEEGSAPGFTEYTKAPIASEVTAMVRRIEGNFFFGRSSRSPVWVSNFSSSSSKSCASPPCCANDSSLGCAKGSAPAPKVPVSSVCMEGSCSK